MRDQADEIEAIALNLNPNQAAGAVQNDLQGQLEYDGYRVLREYGVPNRGDGRGGRIDLVAIPYDLGKQPVAVEIDYMEPRAKSLFKLRAFNGLRVLLMRRAKLGRQAIQDIDLALGLGGDPSMALDLAETDADPVNDKPRNPKRESLTRHPEPISFRYEDDHRTGLPLA